MNGTPLLLKIASMASWMDVPREAAALAKEASGPVLSFCSFLLSQGITPPEYIWYNPHTKSAGLDENCPYVQKYLSIMEKFSSKADVFDDLPPRFGKDAWMLVKTSETAEDDEGWYVEKRKKKKYEYEYENDRSSSLSDLATAALIAGGLLGGVIASKLTRHLPTWSATLGGGMIGGSLGGLAGLISDKLSGRRKRSAMRSLVPLGVALGVVPGLYHGFLNFRASSGKVDNPFGTDTSKPPPPKEDPPGTVKTAQNDTGAFFNLNIPVDKFNRVVWDDPLTPVPVRAATTGLVESASQLRGGTSIVSPYDITKIAIGMGSGWASGTLVGKVLGALAGLPEGAQKELQRAGIWAGFLKSTVPSVFPR